jgi:hypothetical protein
MLQMQDSLLKASAKELLRTDLLHQTQSQMSQHTEYPINSYVLVHYRTGSSPSRLHTNWRGPLRVVKGDNSRYTLYDLVSQKTSVYHVSDMKPFLYDPAITQPSGRCTTWSHGVLHWKDPVSPWSTQTFSDRVLSQMARLPRFRELMGALEMLINFTFIYVKTIYKTWLTNNIVNPYLSKRYPWGFPSYFFYTFFWKVLVSKSLT